MTRPLPLLCLALGAALLTGCPEEEGNRPGDRQFTPPGPRVRFVQLSPDAPMLDVSLGEVKAAGLRFGSTTDYRQATTELRVLRIRDADGALLHQEQVKLTPDTDYAFVISGYAEEGFNALMVNIVTEKKQESRRRLPDAARPRRALRGAGGHGRVERVRPEQPRPARR